MIGDTGVQPVRINNSLLDNDGCIELAEYDPAVVT